MTSPTYLAEGANAIGAYLADGWYRGSYAWNREPNRYGEDTALLAQLELTYSDGRRDTIVTDSSWTWAPGPITASHLYDGEHHDARLVDANWSSPGGGPAGHRSSRSTRRSVTWWPRSAHRSGAPKHVAPLSITDVEPGVQLLDFGQNLVGRLRLTVAGPAGTTVTVRHAEILQGGRLYTRPMRSAKSTDSFTLAGARRGDLGARGSPPTASGTPRSPAGLVISTRPTWSRWSCTTT